MRSAIPVALALFWAHAALAQTPAQGGRTAATCSEPRQASPAFVENLNSAVAGLEARDWGLALGGAALARPHAQSGSQLSAITQVEIVAYHELRNQPAMVERMKMALADACMPVGVRKNYRQMMDKIDAGGTAWPQQQ
jgi:hypothetical protein